MTQQLQRDLRWRESARSIAGLLQSIVAGELLQPSERIWLVSPWISDIPIMDNSAGQISLFAPELPRIHLRLSEVLAFLANQGTVIRIAVRELEHNRPFCAAVQSI